MLRDFFASVYSDKVITTIAASMDGWSVDFSRILLDKLNPNSQSILHHSTTQTGLLLCGDTGSGKLCCCYLDWALGTSRISAARTLCTRSVTVCAGVCLCAHAVVSITTRDIFLNNPDCAFVHSIFLVVGSFSH